MPNSEMMKLIARNGTILSCGCEPPSAATAAGLIGAVGACVLNWLPVHPDQTLPAGELAGMPLPPDAARGAWVWLGSWLTVNVTVSVPPIWPITKPLP